MASTTRRIRVNFDGSVTGLNRAAGQAAQAIDKFTSRTQLAGGALIAAGAAAPALLAGATLLFAGLAAAGLASSEKVKAAFASMGQDVVKGLRQDASVLEGVGVQVAQKLGTAFQSIRPILRDVFATIGPQILTITDGITGLVTNAMPGLANAAKSAGEAVRGLADFLQRVGTGVSGFFDQIATAGPNAGKVWSELGKLMENLLPVLGQLLAVASDFASGALPVLNAALGGLLSIISSVLDFLKPAAPILGAVAAAALATAAAFKVFGMLAALVRTFGAATMLAGVQVGTLIARLGLGAVAGARFATALTSALRLIPIALLAITVGAAGAQTGINNSTQAMLAGGKAAEDYAKSVDGFGTKLLTNLKGFAETLITFGASGGPAEGLATVTERVNELRASMPPLELAQSNVTRAQNDYNLAVQKFGETSPQAIAAQQELGLATDQLATAQENAAAATKSHQAALQELTEFMSGQIDASLAYEQAVNSATEAEKAAAAAVRAHGVDSQQAKDANLELQEAYQQVAQAAQKKAEADNASLGPQQAAAAGADAYRTKLVLLASQQNGPGRSAALGLIDRLGTAELKALNAATATQGFATKVERLPSGREVLVAVDTAAAEAQLEYLARTRYAKIRTGVELSNHIAQGGKSGIATGGPISGPGTGTSDSVGPFWLSNGEHVWTAAEVRRAGGHAAMARMRAQFGGGMADGGPVGSSTAAPSGGVNVSVFIDGREFRGMVRSEISEANRGTRRGATAGAGRGV